MLILEKKSNFLTDPPNLLNDTEKFSPKSEIITKQTEKQKAKSTIV